MSSRYRYQAQAICAAGRLTSPFQEIIDVQGAAAIPDTGGYGCTKVGPFRHREVVRFESATAEVIGAVTYKAGKPSQKEDEVYHTLSKVTIEGLDIAGMVTADRVVACLTSRFAGEQHEPNIKVTGSYFENLRIGGVLFRVDLAIDVLNRLDTCEAVVEKYAGEQELQRLVAPIAANKWEALPERVRPYLNAPSAEGRLPQSKGHTCFSMVRSLVAETREYPVYGHVVYLEGFGVIRLAEMDVYPSSRQLTMISVDLGCPTDGTVQLADVDGGGVRY